MGTNNYSDELKVEWAYFVEKLVLDRRVSR